MIPPTDSIREELSEAVRSGIRSSGPDAVGFILMGMARLIVGASTLGVLLGVGAVSGYDVRAPQFAGVIGAVAAINLIAITRRLRADGSGGWPRHR